MNASKWVSPLFWLSALYDGVLGLLFLAAPAKPFEWFDVPAPNHLGYVQFPAALLVVFALLFAQIARDPLKHQGLILYGLLLKVSYCGVAGCYWLTEGIPVIWKPFVVIDLVMAILFVAAWQQLRRPGLQK